MSEAAIDFDDHRAWDDGPLALCGERLWPDVSGALYWPQARLLVVADLHLEKGAAFAARGQHLPPYDTPDTLAVVEHAITVYRPEIVVALGDSFHRADSHLGLAPEARARIRRLTSAHDWRWIAGNHDPDPPADLGGSATGELRLGPFVFRHEPSAGEARGEVAGHLHPAARVSVRGRTLRRRCFATCGTRLVMPAMGAYTGGLNVLDAAFATVFPTRDFHAWMIGRGEVHPVAAGKLRGGR